MVEENRWRVLNEIQGPVEAKFPHKALKLKPLKIHKLSELNAVQIKVQWQKLAG